MSLGLALAGGGLQGIAHIGAIKAFNDLGIKFDIFQGQAPEAFLQQCMQWDLQQMK